MKSTAHHYKVSTTQFIAILASAAAKIRTLERQAKTLLYDHGDQQGYHNQLREKAILLSELAEELPAADVLPPSLNALSQEKVGSFSFEAERALRLDSVFYMAVLLYPEDYQDGGQNELEVLIDSLTQVFERG